MARLVLLNDLRASGVPPCICPSRYIAQFHVLSVPGDFCRLARRVRTMSDASLTADIKSRVEVRRYGPILLQKSFFKMALKFSDPWVQRLNSDVGDHVAKRQTNR